MASSSFSTLAWFCSVCSWDITTELQATRCSSRTIAAQSPLGKHHMATGLFELKLLWTDKDTIISLTGSTASSWLCAYRNVVIPLASGRQRYNTSRGLDHYWPCSNSVTVYGEALKSIETFCFFGSVLAQNAKINDENTERISKAVSSYGRLKKPPMV